MKKIIILLLMTTSCLFSMEFDLKNELTFSGRVFADSRQICHAFANYKPDIFITLFNYANFSFDSEQTLELYYSYQKSDSGSKDKFDLSLYRSWFRFSAAQYEVRIGRQKLNFGPAQILRPLKWFDTIDPADPQKNSKGADALLFRYYFLNNANFWFWLIDPQNNPATKFGFFQNTDGYEFGSRLQYPFKYCEAAFTYHHRNLQKNITSSIDFDAENRFGLDCRWDFRIGLWIETMYIALTEPESALYSNQFTIGLDYTLTVGNGLYLLAEHMFYNRYSSDIPTLFQDSSASACLLNYPLGLFDSVSAMINYDWINENFYYFASYSIIYDLLSFYLNFFWNSDHEESPLSSYNQDGKSVQFLIEINF